MTLRVGDPAPDFALRNQARQQLTLHDLRGSKTALVFIPFAFTRVCHGELCEIRDNMALFSEADTRVVAVTCNTLHSNGVWAEQEGFEFDILSDFWPHGEVAKAYEAFDASYGYATRTTYFLDEEGVVTDVVASDELGIARPFELYHAALSS